MMKSAGFLILAFPLFLWGCAIGPGYHRPAVEAPEAFRGQEGSIERASFANLPWWDVFQDETLRDLIRRGFANNYDIRIAATRVEQARAIAAQARAEMFPRAGYQAEGAHGRSSFLGNAIPPGAERGNAVQSSFLGAFNVAWEVDLFGRIRRADEVVRARFLASEEGRRGVMLTLLGDIARAYYELLELDRELEITKMTTESFAGSLKIFNERLQAGVASKLETSRAEAALASAASVIPEIEREILLKENQVSVLLGSNPGPIRRGAGLLEQAVPPDVPAGIPSELLERRPDIREAEQNLRAATAFVGVAIGEFFPRIGLTALFGGVSTELADITSGGARTWSAGANITGPIFQGGRLRAQVRQARASWEEARLRYEQTALTAFQEVSSALSSREKFERIRDQQERSVNAYTEAVRVSLKRYIAGKASYYEVLEAQQQLYPAEISLARTRLNRLLVIVQLYKALGGGWEEAGSEAPSTARPKEKSLQQAAKAEGAR
jgi:multidrug efflux system outer membrane protein